MENEKTIIAAYSEEERDKIQQAFETLLDDIRPNMPDHGKLQLIDDAYHYCLEVYDGKYMVSGKPYMFHLIDLVRIVVLELGLGYMSVIAAFLHGVTYKKGVEIDDIEAKFGKPIAVILKGFDRISALRKQLIKSKLKALTPGRYRCGYKTKPVRR